MDPEQLRQLAARFGWTDEETAAVSGLTGPAVATGSNSADTLFPGEDDVETTVHTPAAERYEIVGRIGVGGMGVVHRAKDAVLGRTVAMKTCSLGGTSAPKRFVHEARTTAQLEHPGIVPVHDLGTMLDGRPYFTMTEVRGRTLRAVLRDFHKQGAASGWTLRRLVDQFLRACEAVAYAHDRGVVHRDLKPANIVLGEHGEVLVLDWGLAKVLGDADIESSGSVEVTDSSTTQHGEVAGTPSYMPPEIAAGGFGLATPRSDVYSLGASLYEVLSGKAPYTGDADAVLVQVMSHPAPPLDSSLPTELVELCARAMTRAAGDRPKDAGVLATLVRSWLDGATAREHALAVVTQAEAAFAQVAELRARAAQMRQSAEKLLADVQEWETEERKAKGWDLADHAHALERDAERAALENDARIQGALAESPDLPEAHAILARRRLAEHARAEAEGQREAALRAEIPLRNHVAALPADHPMRRRCQRWLDGMGALTLICDPPTASVELLRYEPHRRRLVAKPYRNLGKAPLLAVDLPMGSYLCILRAEGCEDVRYPVLIGREQHWDGVPPQATEPTPIVLPRAGTLGHDDVYVPAGWFVAQGDPDAYHASPRVHLWCDALVMRRYAVTNREYIAFLDDLVATGRGAEADRHAPRERGTGGERGPLIHGREGDRFVLRADADGDVWEPDWPVVMVDCYGAEALASWEAHRTGQPFRLPSETEWEKTARGVDGRLFPWGNTVDPSWCSCRAGQRARATIMPVGRYPIDESPYGVRDLAGNVKEWCVFDAGTVRDERGAVVALPQRYSALETTRAIRGGAWTDQTQRTRAADRPTDEADNRRYQVGIRLARSFSG